MIVTDLEYHLETKLIKKLDIMINMCTNATSRKDAVLIVEGAEGEGKTNSSEAIAYYLKHKMNRDIHMFFRLKSLVEYAKETENKILIWDEPALDSLSTDWWKETNKDLIRLLMTCRKKRHFFLFNFVKFYKFSEYVVVDRALGLIHMYSRNGIIPGRFVYIKRRPLEKLFNMYRTKKIRGYKQLKSFGGSFPIVEKHLHKMGITIEGHPNASLDDYERLKSKAIGGIGHKTATKKDTKGINDLKVKISNLECPIKTREELAEKMGYSLRQIQKWKHIASIDPHIEGVSGNEPE